MVDRGSMVNWGRFIWSWSWLVRSWGGFVGSWSRLVWGRSRGIDNWGCFDNRGNFDNRGYFDNRSIRGRCNLDYRSGGCLVGRRSRFVRCSLSIDCLSFILDISDITFGPSSVGDNLNTTIRQVDTVLPSSVVVLSILRL